VETGTVGNICPLWPYSCSVLVPHRDAEDSVRGRDGYVFDGYRIRVEFPRSSSRGSRGGDGGGGGGGGGYGGGRKFRSRGGHQLLVSGLPPTGSWQDVKDHFREAGDVVYADVYKDGTGIIEFSRYEHMKRALRDLDDSKFRSHEVCSSLTANTCGCLGVDVCILSPHIHRVRQPTSV